MVIGKHEIENIALLARLALEEEEKESLEQQLNSVLDYVDKLKELDTEQTEPLVNILLLTNVMRVDEINAGPEREEMLKNGPEVEEGYFKVPGVSSQ